MPKFHLFVDCESKDKTKEIIKNYQKQNFETEVIILSQNDVGVYNAWNQGLVSLLGIVDNNHFIVILNSDDWLEDEYISRQENVPIITLDEYCKKNNIGNIDILKIDTQGYEDSRSARLTATF